MVDYTLREIGFVFDFILQDITSKKRQKQSVVTISMASAGSVDPNRSNLVGARLRQYDDIARLLANDVIVVTAAGNDAKEKDVNGNLRVNVDTAPAVFEGPDYPLIVVGATDFTGTPAGYSQLGDHVTILGPGSKILCQDKALNAPITESGTSFCMSKVCSLYDIDELPNFAFATDEKTATPLIAGILATFLAYDEVPFDTSTGNVAANAKKYLQDTANWSRRPNVKVIWNGVTEANNPKEVAGADSRTTSLTTPAPAIPTVAPVDPPSAPTCAPNPTAAIKDSHENELKKAATFFCTQYASNTVLVGPVDNEQMVVSGVISEGRENVDMARLYTGTQNEDDVYNISVKSVPNCTPDGGFDLGTPVTGNKCSDILHSAWKKCKSSVLHISHRLLTGFR